VATGHVSKQYFECFMNAHDLILLSSSVSGLQDMLNICDLYATNHVLVFSLKNFLCCSWQTSLC